MTRHYWWLMGIFIFLLVAKPVAADDMDDPDMKELMQWANWIEIQSAPGLLEITMIMFIRLPNFNILLSAPTS